MFESSNLLSFFIPLFMVLYCLIHELIQFFSLCIKSYEYSCSLHVTPTSLHCYIDWITLFSYSSCIFLPLLVIIVIPQVNLCLFVSFSSLVTIFRCINISFASIKNEFSIVIINSCIQFRLCWIVHTFINSNFFLSILLIALANIYIAWDLYKQ